jgi:hypothetical protein
MIELVDQACGSGRLAEGPGVGGVDGDVEQQRVQERAEPRAAVGGELGGDPFVPGARAARQRLRSAGGRCARALALASAELGEGDVDEGGIERPVGRVDG